MSGEATSSGKPKKTRIVIAAAAIAALLAAVLASSLGQREQPSTTPTPAAATATAADAVRGYLEALAAGNATAALAFGTSIPDNSELLTDAALAEANRRGGVSNITVGTPADPNSTRVAAAYSVGTTPVKEVFALTQVNGAWRLDKTYNILELTVGPRAEINGQKAPDGEVPVFPGTYALTWDIFVAQYVDPTMIIIGGVGQPPPVPPGPELKAETKAHTVRFVRGRFNECLREHSTALPDCPFGGLFGSRFKVDGEKRTDLPVDSTVRWRRVGGDPFTTKRTRLSSFDFGPTVTFRYAAEVRFTLRVKGTARCQRDNTRCTDTYDQSKRAYLSLNPTGPPTIAWR